MMPRRKKKMYYIFNISDERFITFCAIFISAFVLVFWSIRAGMCQGWPDIKVRLLPDDSFAVVEYDAATRMWYCPHHDQNGKLDEEQLIYVLGMLDQETWLDQKHRKVAKKHLEKHYDKFRTKIQKRGLQSPVNINKARLTGLVTLPQVGPVLAVKINEYRNTHNMYMTIEDIMKVEGIGPGTFNAIRHYISTN
jgi:competence ComEA-like helix-hairpin-helix protein